MIWLQPPFDLIVAVVLAPFVGSFVGLLADRMPAGDGVLLGRSRCAHCGTTLKARDLVPFWSWLSARGRCRHCGAELGRFYPLVEMAACLVPVSAALWSSGAELWFACLFGWILMALAIIDWRALILPDSLTAALFLTGAAATAVTRNDLLITHLMTSAVGLAIFWGVAAAYRRLRRRDGLGFGDAKLIAGLGVWMGPAALPVVVLVASLTGLIGVTGRRLAQGGHAGTWQEPVAFGSHLCLAAWAVWLAGLAGPVWGNG